MPRPLRIGTPGDIVNVTSRGNRRQAIYLDNYDRLTFLHMLSRTVVQYDWHCYAFCLMGNHYHFLLELTEWNLSAGIQLLNGSYAQGFNERWGVDGHLFQGRFYSERIETDSHLMSAIRYIDLNPVRAGLVGTPAAWEWSSYNALVGDARVPSFLAATRTRELFHPVAARGADAYRRFVADAAVPAVSGV